MLRALIFDFDGTILDTEMPWYRAWQEVYGAHGAELALTEWAQAVGTSDEAFDPVIYLAGLTGRQVEREAAEAAARERALALIGRERLRAGFVELLDAAHARGLRVGLASSSSVGNALPVTGALRLLRAALLDGAAPASEAGDLALYTLLGLAFVGVGLIALRRAERRALEGSV
jgi:beta-phosphoglucomutase-like phosphatase (HAD superfamily)